MTETHEQPDPGESPALPAPTGTIPPIRIITRLIVELHAAITGPGVRLLGGDINRFAIYTLIVRQSPDSAASAADGPHPGISAYSIANSLSLPYETVRRQVAWLTAQGWSERRGRSAIVASPQILASPEAIAMQVLIHDSLVRFIADIARLKAVPLPRMPQRTGATAPFTLV